MTPNLDADILDDFLADPVVQELLAMQQCELATFQPRPDRPHLHDQQSGFVNSPAKVSVCLGGNGSGKSTASAYKAARFMLTERAPTRPDLPFWVVSNTYDQVCGIAWQQGLSRFIPHDQIDWPRVRWLSSKLNWPSHVPLKPWPGSRNNWIIEFRSTESGAQAFSGRSIGGAWFSEQFPWEVFIETMRGLRDTYFDGGVIIECTPSDPDLSIELEALHEDPPEGWAFYRLNTDCNAAVSDEWRKGFFAAVSDEMQATRRTGAFASYQGQIYQAFNPRVHLVGDDVICHPPGVYYRRGIDWGESAEHPFVCLWAYRDGSGNWFVFDEYVDDAANLYEHRAHVIRTRWPWPTDFLHGYAYADPSRPGLIHEFSFRGIPTCPASNDVHAGIEHVRSLLKLNPVTNEPSLYIHKRNCPVLAAQMRKYRWRRSSQKGLNPIAARNEPLKRQDDCCDALRYLVFSDRQHEGLAPDSIRRDTDARRYGIMVDALTATGQDGWLRTWRSIGLDTRRN